MQFHCLYNDALSTHKGKLCEAFCFGNGCLILWRKNIYSTAACKCKITRPSVWSLTCHKARADDKELKLEARVCHWFEIDQIAQSALLQDTPASMGLTLDERKRRVANSPDIQPLRRNDSICIKKTETSPWASSHCTLSSRVLRGASERHYSGENTESTRLTVSPKSRWKATRTTPQQDTGFRYQGLSPRPGAESHGKFQVCVLSARGSAAQDAATHLWDPIMRSLRPSLRWKPGM